MRTKSAADVFIQKSRKFSIAAAGAKRDEMDF